MTTRTHSAREPTARTFLRSGQRAPGGDEHVVGAALGRRGVGGHLVGPAGPGPARRLEPAEHPVDVGLHHPGAVDVGEVLRDPGPRRLTQSTSHPANFIDCVLSRQEPISPLDSAIRSDLISHLGNIAVRTGREITWDAKAETIVNDDEAKAMMVRPMREPWNVL